LTVRLVSRAKLQEAKRSMKKKSGSRLSNWWHDILKSYEIY